MFWSIIIVVYVVSFWAWQVSQNEAIETRKKLYPGREQERIDDQRFSKISLAWCAGLAALLAIWFAMK